MARIAVNLNDAKEPKPVPNGMYDLTIASVEEGKSKEKQKPQLRVSVGIDGHDDAPNVGVFLSLPDAGDEPKSAQFKALLLKRFCVLFGIPIDADGGFDTDDFPGSKARAELKLGEANDAGVQCNELVVPKLRGEGTQVGRVPPPPKA